LRINGQLYAFEFFGKSLAASDILANMDNSGQANAIAGAITVSQLNRQVKTLLEQGLPRLWVDSKTVPRRSGRPFSDSASADRRSASRKATRYSLSAASAFMSRVATTS
jgi:hypothetical protein